MPSPDKAWPTFVPWMACVHLLSTAFVLLGALTWAEPAEFSLLPGERIPYGTALWT